MKTYYICRCVTFDQTLDRVSESCISYFTGWIPTDGKYCVPGWSDSTDDAIGFASLRDVSSLLCYVAEDRHFYDFFIDEREV